MAGTDTTSYDTGSQSGAPGPPRVLRPSSKVPTAPTALIRTRDVMCLSHPLFSRPWAPRALPDTPARGATGLHDLGSRASSCACPAGAHGRPSPTGTESLWGPQKRAEHRGGPLAQREPHGRVHSTAPPLSGSFLWVSSSGASALGSMKGLGNVPQNNLNLH